MDLTSETISNNLIELHEDEEGYGTVHLEMPHPVNEIKFIFGSADEAMEFLECLKAAICVSSPLTHLDHDEQEG